MAEPSRYAGRAFVRLLECYVLHAAGLLDAADEAGLVEMTPKLRAVYKLPGTWYEIIAVVMEFPPNMPDLVRASWEKNSALARQNGEQLLAQHFAEMFVDANFVPDDQKA